MFPNAIYFDMDGTLAGFYDRPHWLEDLEHGYTRPYREAKPLIDMRKLSKILRELQRKGITIGIISWLSKGGNDDFNERVTNTKMRWLNSHIGSVQWDEIHIIPYGVTKSDVADIPNGWLFDDEERNRTAWTGLAFNEQNIIEILEVLL